MRIRFNIIAALLAVIVLGLCSRKFPWLFPAGLGKYPGDALWAVAAYLGWALLLPNAKPWKLLLLALAMSFSVEFSQIYRAPWLDAIRANPLGHLFLGSTFNPMDLIAYLTGALIIFSFDAFLSKKMASRTWED